MEITCERQHVRGAPIPAELEALFTRMRFPHARKAAPEVLATARAQRWDPAEVVRVLLAEEVIGRDNATRSSRRESANLPDGKTFDSWNCRPSRKPPRTPCGPWRGPVATRTA
ncbi:hypothetical protein ACWEJ6_49130 [Nonomuraea sp. NPDC004702]